MSEEGEIEERLKMLQLSPEIGKTSESSDNRSYDLCNEMNRCLKLSVTPQHPRPGFGGLPPQHRTVKRTHRKPLSQKSDLNYVRKSKYIRSPKLKIVNFQNKNTSRPQEKESSSEETNSTNVQSPIQPNQSSCSHEARNSYSNDDVDELAFYFDYHLQIPKKMSPIAYIMYT